MNNLLTKPIRLSLFMNLPVMWVWNMARGNPS